MSDQKHATATATTATETAPPSSELARLIQKPMAPTFGPAMELTTLRDAMAFADVVFASGLAPKGMNREGIVIAIQMGYEVGLSPMQAVQNIAPINGRPAIFGDAGLALVRKSGLIESYAEEAIGEPGADARGCRVTVKRKGQPEATEEFTVADAKRAKLWGKPGPWSEYPQRMLKWRARGFILRDQFGDVLKGLRLAEEVQDDPTEYTAPAAEAPAAPPAALAIVKPRRKAATPAEGAEQAAKDAANALSAPPAANPDAPRFQPTSALAAVEAAGCDRGLFIRWLKGTGRWPETGGLDGLSAELCAYCVQKPAAVARDVSKYVEADDAAREQELSIMDGADQKQEG